ncbi:MAG TPA: hypothetical protein VIZ28_14165 [Chitinophagaceae bacterium]
MNYTDWKEHFLRNQSHFKDIDFSEADSLTKNERSAIYVSLQQFQRGENSEGKHLFSFAKKNPDPEYLPCISLFIREEQTHARVLGAFMDRYGIQKIKSHWVDAVFRGLRKMAGLENTIRVLLTAEIIAKVYYKALHNATHSQLLQKICRQILRDEDQHIAFQCFTLSPFYKQKSVPGKLLVRSWHFILMTGTILVVWWHHKKVFRKGGYGLRKFFSDTLAVFFGAERSIRSKEFSVIRKELASA